MMMHGPGPMGDGMHGEIGEGKTVKGSPLTGQLTVTRDTTLADGTRIHKDNQASIYRDSEGRVRREMSMELVTPATGAVSHSMVMILDPVSGQRYMLNPANKTARAMPARGHHDGPKGEAPHADMAPHEGPGEIKKESLGNKTVDGLVLEGVRVTRTIPEGAIGNDKAIEVVTERWYSQELQLPVLTIHNDPMMGKVTTKLTVTSRGEPDPSLFQVPADYKLESGKPGETVYMPLKH